MSLFLCGGQCVGDGFFVFWDNDGFPHIHVVAFKKLSCGWARSIGTFTAICAI